MKLQYIVIEEKQKGGHMGKVFSTFPKALKYAQVNNYNEIDIRRQGWTAINTVGKVIL